jgi:hypothetical protein
MDEEGLIEPGEVAFHLDLTPAQLKIVHTALRTLVDDLGRHEHDVRDIAQEVLAKMPGEHDIRAINIDRGR